MKSQSSSIILGSWSLSKKGFVQWCRHGHCGEERGDGDDYCMAPNTVQPLPQRNAQTEIDLSPDTAQASQLTNNPNSVW